MQESTVYRSIFAESETSGEQRKQREIANNFLREGLPVEIVARGTGYRCLRLSEAFRRSPATATVN